MPFSVDQPFTTGISRSTSAWQRLRSVSSGCLRARSSSAEVQYASARVASVRRLHREQHPLHVGVLDDGRGLRALHAHGLALQALARPGERALVGALGDRHALEADREARGVHHDEHVLEAAVRLAHEVADGAVLLAVGHHRRRARVDAELVLDRDALHVVALAERAVGVHQELGHDEERDALHALGRAVDARQHQVDDVLGVVVLAVGDEDLLALEAVGAVGLRRGLGAHERQVAAGLRLGEVHRAGPLARDHVRQELLAQRLGPDVVDRLDRALGEHRAELEREVRRAPHLLDRRRDAGAAGPGRRTSWARGCCPSPPSRTAGRRP